jgi:L-asparaginase II
MTAPTGWTTTTRRGMLPAMTHVVVAEVVRSGFIESVHYGSAIALSQSGEVVVDIGGAKEPIFPRSSNKPLQAAAMIRAGLGGYAASAMARRRPGGHATGAMTRRRPGGRAADARQAAAEGGHSADSERVGLAGDQDCGPRTRRVADLDDRHLALISASHSGEPFHIEGVDQILSAAGLDRSALRCPPDLPLDPDAASELLRSGGMAEPVYMNCSGKHAGMLATCVAAGWSTDGYTDPDHPLQKEIRESIERLTGEVVRAVGVDGCGAALFGTSLLGLARSFRALVLADPGSPERRIADAIRAHSEFVSGSRRDESALMAGVPGLVIKGGAEGVAAFALPDGRAGAIKIADGSARARIPVVISALRKLGVEVPVLEAHATTPVLGGGRRVGEVRSAI